jgi:hypothetical protein
MFTCIALAPLLCLLLCFPFLTDRTFSLISAMSTSPINSSQDSFSFTNADFAFEQPSNDLQQAALDTDAFTQASGNSFTVEQGNTPLVDSTSFQDITQGVQQDLSNTAGFEGINIAYDLGQTFSPGQTGNSTDTATSNSTQGGTESNANPATTAPMARCT